MDKRRSRWIAFDVYFFDDDLGVAIRDRFGPVGLVLFTAFLCACKRNSVQGQFRYTSDAEALTVLGLPGMELVDEQGEPFTLDEFWTLLGQRKQTRRTRRGRITDVVSTRWERWQKGYGSRGGDEETGRSGPGNTEQIADETESITALDPDPDSDNDTDNTPPAPPAQTMALALVPSEVSPAVTDPIETVFGAWCRSTNKRGAVLDQKRRKFIKAALGMFPIEDVVDAVDGWRHSPHHRGENERNTVYNEIPLLLRDAGQIEKFRDLTRGVIARPDEQITRPKNADVIARFAQREGA